MISYEAIDLVYLDSTCSLNIRFERLSVVMQVLWSICCSSMRLQTWQDQKNEVPRKYGNHSLVGVGFFLVASYTTGISAGWAVK